MKGVTSAQRLSPLSDGRLYRSLDQLSGRFENGGKDTLANETLRIMVPYLSLEPIRAFATEILDAIHYKQGAVDVAAVCDAMSLKLRFNPRSIHDEDGSLNLGSANFARNTIGSNPQPSGSQAIPTHTSTTGRHTFLISVTTS